MMPVSGLPGETRPAQGRIVSASDMRNTGSAAINLGNNIVGLLFAGTAATLVSGGIEHLAEPDQGQ
jgi:hypothetical protein